MSTLPLFDPTTVPVVAVDTQLPPIAADRLLAQAIAARFAHPPHDWEPELRTERRFSDRAPAHAAVLIPLVLREPLSVLLTQRTTRLSSHSGQIAFPGGKVDPGDANPVATALRETEEEIGLPPEKVRVLGALPIYTTGSAFIVTPVVGLVEAGFSLRPNEHEVADVFEVPLPFLMNPSHHRHHEVKFEGESRRWLSMPYQDASTERFIWGATAGMLRNLYRFLAHA